MPDKEWKIYTKTGDRGETSLIGGRRVPKHHKRIDAYGTLDELNSFTGYLRDQISDEHIREVLLRVQENLFVAESILATDPETSPGRELPYLTEKDITDLEIEMDVMNQHLPELRSFILPGGYPLVSLCHVCRTVCRRGERIITDLSLHHEVDEIILRFVNRLSDYFFVLARKIASLYGVEDLPWKHTANKPV